MSASNVPVPKECSVAGKKAYSVWRTTFEVDERYEPIKAIGKGAYGVVCSARDGKTGEKVAVKKITNAFENLVDARRTLREMRLLRHLRWVSCLHDEWHGRRVNVQPCAAWLLLPCPLASLKTLKGNCMLARRHDNVIAVRDIMRPPNKLNFTDVYIVYELMDTDLHQIIRSSQPLSDEHYQYFVYQVQQWEGGATAAQRGYWWLLCCMFH
jgi:serine/threonine protein kinase